jgi:lipopolysaccharide export system protein LptC
MSQKLLFPLLVTVIAGLSYWLLSFELPEGVTLVARSPDSPQSFMEGIRLRAMNEQGFPRFELQAAGMTRYADDKRTEVEQPFLIVFRPSGEVWTAQAESGTAINDDELVTLHGAVVVRHPIDPGRPEGDATLEIRTRDLVVRPREEFAETKQLTTLVRPEGRVEAVGMKAYFPQERVQLLSQVRGTYEGRL